MKLIRLDNDASSLIIGIKKIYIENPRSFLEKLRERFPSLTIQALDANFIAGYEHLKSILYQSWTAFKRDISYSKKLDLELIVRMACDSQINRALKIVGLKSGIMNLAIVAMGDQRNLKLFAEDIKSLGEISESVLKLTPKKENFLIEHHDLSSKLLQSTISYKNKLAAILSEKANLLRI